MGEDGSYLADDVDRPGAELFVKLDSDPTTRTSEPQGAFRDCPPGHLLQAERLSAELEVCGVSVALTHLVLDRYDPAGRIDLYGISTTGQPEAFRPQRYGAQNVASALDS